MGIVGHQCCSVLPSRVVMSPCDQLEPLGPVGSHLKKNGLRGGLGRNNLGSYCLSCCHRVTPTIDRTQVIHVLFEIRVSAVDSLFKSHRGRPLLRTSPAGMHINRNITSASLPFKNEHLFLKTPLVARKPDAVVKRRYFITFSIPTGASNLYLIH